MEVGTPFEEFVKKTVKDLPTSFSGWQQVQIQFASLSTKAEDVSLVSLVELVQCLSDELGSPEQNKKFDAAERIELNRWATLWWQHCFQKIAELSPRLTQSIEPEAVLLNIYHHAVAAGEMEVAGETHVCLKFFRDTVLPREKQSLRLEKLKKELETISKIKKAVGFGIKNAAPLGLEKAGFRIEWATDGSFEIIPPKNAPPVFPVSLFFESLEFFFKKGLADGRILDKFLNALAPHLNIERDKESLDRGFLTLYGEKKLSQWKSNLYCLQVFDFSDDKKFERLTQLTDTISKLPESYKFDAACAIILLCEGWNMDSAKAEVLKRLMYLLAILDKESIPLFEKLLITSASFSGEISKSEVLAGLCQRVIFINLKNRPNLISAFKFMNGVCHQFKQEAARIKLLDSMWRLIHQLPRVNRVDAFYDLAHQCDQVGNADEKAQAFKQLAIVIFTVNFGDHRITLVERLLESTNKLKNAELEELLARFLG